MKFKSFVQLSALVLCLTHNSCGGETLIDTFNEIYETCLVHLNTDCVQPRALQWLSKSIEKREISITDDLTIVRNESIALDVDPDETGSARDNRIDILSYVDEFLSTHYLNIRYPKAAITDNIPSVLQSTVDRFIPDSIQMPLEEGNVNEGRGLVKKVLVPFLLGLKFKTTVLLPLAFALIALKAWKALTLGLVSLVVSTAVVVFKLTKPKVVNYELVHYPHHHHYDHHLDHLEHHHAHALDHHHLDHLDVHPQIPHAHIELAPHAHLEHLAPHAHIEHLAPHAHIDAHDIAYPAHL